MQGGCKTDKLKKIQGHEIHNSDSFTCPPCSTEDTQALAAHEGILAEPGALRSASVTSVPAVRAVHVGHFPLPGTPIASSGSNSAVILNYLPTLTIYDK